MLDIEKVKEKARKEQSKKEVEEDKHMEWQFSQKDKIIKNLEHLIEKHAKNGRISVIYKRDTVSPIEKSVCNHFNNLGIKCYTSRISRFIPILREGIPYEENGLEDGTNYYILFHFEW